MWEVLLEALLDSLKALAVLVVVYILIGLLESRITNTLEKSKRWTPLFAVGLSALPQCGLSVIATDLYAKKHLALGTLVGVYLATSDEAVPILLSQPGKALTVLPLIAIKLVVGIAAAYILNAIFSSEKVEVQTHIEQHCEHDEQLHTGCCNHQIEKGNKLSQYLLHPLAHSLKIFAYILVINVIFGLLLFCIGEDKISSFLSHTQFYAPLLCVLVGLIPNCASSVVITNVFLEGFISFGACVGGLCANAGLGLLFLFKDCRNKRSLVILALLIAISLLIGYSVALIEHFCF